MNQFELARALSARFDCRVSLLQAGRYDRILFFGFRPQESCPFLVCRMGRTPEAAGLLREQAERRTSIRASLPETLRETVPWALMEGEVLIEPFLRGKPGAPTDLPQALDWLRAYQQATRQPAPGLLVAQAEECLERGRFIRPLQEGLSRLPTDCLEGLTPTGVHGDFWYGNLLKEDQSVRVIDWEYHQPLGNPYFDPLFALITAGPDHAPCGIPEEREARSLTAILVLLTLVLRDGLEAEPTQSRFFPLLETILQPSDPLQAVDRLLFA